MTNQELEKQEKKVKNFNERYYGAKDVTNPHNLCLKEKCDNCNNEIIYDFTD